MSKKNVLTILGSPHTNGATAAMLNLAVQFNYTKKLIYGKIVAKW